MGEKPARNIQFSVLERSKRERIHEASLHLIEKVGMKIGGERALGTLKHHGAETGADGLTRIPRRLVEHALYCCPKEMTLFTRDGQPAILLDAARHTYFGCHSDMMEFVDPGSGQVRNFLRQDIKTMCRLADALPNIHFALSVGLASDVPPEIQAQVSFLDTVRHFGKTINFSTNNVESLPEILEIAAVVAGGPQSLRQKPFLFYYCEPIPPLQHPRESTEKLILCAERGVPVVYMPYCMMGGTSPMSFASTLAQCNAEVLTGLTLTQLVSEGAPFIYGAMPSLMDMRTTIGSYGAAEFHLLVAAASELADHYCLPFYGTAGCTDARLLDEQAVAESTLELFSTLLSKANLVHDIGVSDHCRSVNPELVLLCDELISMLRAYTQGVEVNDETLALTVIEQVGPGGAYLSEMHTLERCRDIFYPSFFSRKMNNPDRSEVRDALRARLGVILLEHPPRPLDPAVEAQLQRWIGLYGT